MMKFRRRAFNKAIKSILVRTAVILILMQSFVFSSYALEDWPTECSVLSEGACLMDGDSGVVLYDQNADVSYYPASITKVLTALVVLENCDNLSETVTVSYDAVHIEEQNSTIIGASEGDRLSVLDCLYCLLFQSANEVANALAEHVGARYPELKEKGETDQQVFVKLMNRKAEELGCTGSHFNNPSGLTDEEHYTTPHDMCLIMQAAIRNKEFCEIESHTYWTHAPISRYPDAEDPWNTVYMKHMMLRKNSEYYYEGCIAGKTGYTQTAGNTLVTACRRDGMTLICCVMNAHANHYRDTTALFDFGFANFKSVSVSEYDQTDSLVQEDFKVNGIPVMDSMTLAIDPESKMTLPKAGELTDVTSEFRKTEDTDAEAKAVICYFYGEKQCGKTSLKKTALGGMQEAKEAEEDPLFGTLVGTEAVSETPVAEESSAAEEQTGQGAEVSASEENRTAGDSGETSADKNGTEKAGDQSKTIRLICIGVLVLVAVLGGLVIMKYRQEAREEKRRHARRLKRMQEMSDLTGSQQIALDLEVRKRMEKKKKSTHEEV